PSFFSFISSLLFYFLFLFHTPAPTEIYTLSLHDALPILKASTSGGIAPEMPYVAPSVAFPVSRFTDVTSQHYTSLMPAHLKRYQDRKSTRLNSSHLVISYAVFCLKKKKKK